MVPAAGAPVCAVGADRTRRRSFVHRTRSGLRNNHARRRRLAAAGNDRGAAGRGATRSLGAAEAGTGGSMRGAAAEPRGRRRRGRRSRGTRRWRAAGGTVGAPCAAGFSAAWRQPLRDAQLAQARGSLQLRAWRTRLPEAAGLRRWRAADRWRSAQPAAAAATAAGGAASFLLLRNRLQHISGPGDVRQIDLGLDFFFAAQWARRARRRRLRFGRAADVGPYFFSFMLLERTGMGLLLRHPDER